MLDEVYEEVPKEFSIAQVRPRFKLNVKYWKVLFTFLKKNFQQILAQYQDFELLDR